LLSSDSNGIFVCHTIEALKVACINKSDPRPHIAEKKSLLNNIADRQLYITPYDFSKQVVAAENKN